MRLMAAEIARGYMLLNSARGLASDPLQARDLERAMRCLERAGERLIELFPAATAIKLEEGDRG